MDAMDGIKRINNDSVNIVASTKRKTVSSKCESESPLFDDVSAAYKSLKAETIEVVPEIIPFDDSEYEHDQDDDDCDNDNDDDGDDDDNIDFDGIEKTTNSMRNFYDYNDNEQDDFDEYGYQVKWNGPSEPILFDNSEIRKMDMTDDDDYDEDDVDEAGNVILIESEDDGSGESGSLRTSRIKNADGSTSDAGGDRKMYECDICCRKVASSYNLKRHMMIHTGEKPYGCDICCRRFREFSDLKKHRRVHSTEKQFKCMTCHRNPPSATNATKCATCESTEAAQKSQELAMEQIIPRFDGNKKAFVCTYCDRVFGSSSNLKRHIMIHTGEKPFTCNICQRSFREMSTLKKHSFTHRNHMAALAAVMPALRAPSPPLKCYVCPKAFIDANQFKQHVLSHSDAQHDLPEITMKPVMMNSKIYHHKCPKCNEIFYESSKLMLHICSVHKVNGATTTTATKTTTSTTNAKPAAMTLTKTVSKVVTSLRKPASSPPPLIPINRLTFAARMHQMSVGDAIPTTMAQYYCKICSKKFRSQQHLLSHQLTHIK